MTRLARIDVQTKFRIDTSWWETQGQDFRAQVIEALCDECRALYAPPEPVLVDRVDMLTGEVRRIDSAWDCLIDECGQDQKFINPTMPVTRLIFRAFLASGNEPLSAEEIYRRIRKGTPAAILKELLHRSADEFGIVPDGL